MSGKAADLVSGLWAGFYEQARARHPQRMTLEFADGLVRGDGIDGLGPFSIDGEYRVEEGEVRMGWIKTYEHAHSVLYLGSLVDGVIRGRWSLTGGSGAFALEPSRAWDPRAAGGDA
jgi:hypothetical protein